LIARPLLIILLTSFYLFLFFAGPTSPTTTTRKFYIVRMWRTSCSYSDVPIMISCASYSITMPCRSAKRVVSKTEPFIKLPYYAEACNEFVLPISASRQHSYLLRTVDVEAVANRLQRCVRCGRRGIRTLDDLVCGRSRVRSFFKNLNEV